MPATRRAHSDGMNRFILPVFGDRRVNAVTAKDACFVAGVLGHTDIKTIFGYAQFSEDSVFDAANRVSRGLVAMLYGGETGR